VTILWLLCKIVGYLVAFNVLAAIVIYGTAWVRDKFWPGWGI